MTEKINSAARILNILQRASAYQGNNQAFDAWAKLFNIKEQDSIKRNFMVSQSVYLVYNELELASSGLHAINFSKTAYESAFAKIQAALSPTYLSSSWSSVLNFITPDVLTALSFCKEILPDEESEISKDDLSEIQKCVEDLKSSLSQTKIPDRLRTLIVNHIRLIEEAISEYSIVGAKAFRQAGRSALGEMIEVKDEILPAKDSEILKKLDATWKKVNSVADIAIKVEKVAKIGSNIFNFLENLL